MSDKYQKASDLGEEIAKLSKSIETINELLGKVTLRADITGNGKIQPSYVLKDSSLLFELLKRHKVDLEKEFIEIQKELSILLTIKTK